MTKQQNKKPTGWKEAKLEEIGIFSKGRGISKAQVESKGLNAIRYGELYTKHNIKINRIYSHISKEVSNQSKEIKTGDILLAGSGETIDEIGKSATYLYPQPCYAGGDIIIFTPFKQNSLYLAYLFNSKMQKDLRRLGQGQSIVHIHAVDIKRINVLLPPADMQKSIVDVLETWDLYLEKLEKKIKIKKNIKKSLMQKLLTGKVRLPGFSEPWETKPLSYYIASKLRPINKPNTSFTAIGIRSHCKGTFQKNNFDPNKIDMDILYEIKENDLIVNITFAWEGAIAIVRKEDDGGLVSHRFPTYTFIQRISNSNFFRQFIQIKRIRYMLGVISPGGAGRNRVLSKKDFLKIKFSAPNYEEQTAIANILTTADEEIEMLEKQRDHIMAQKKYLLNNLITGKIRLPEFRN